MEIFFAKRCLDEQSSPGGFSSGWLPNPKKSAINQWMGNFSIEWIPGNG
jgi:hypothetical protein